MKVSIFENSWDKDPKVIECTWDYLTKTLGPHDYTYTEKLATPSFCPAEFLPGTTCAAANVSRLWLFVADLDHLNEDAARDVLRGVQGAGLAAIAYTSWSHAADPWRLRVVLPLTRPVPVDAWPGFWAQMNRAFGGRCDPKCADPSRIYYAPYAPPGTEDKNFYLVFPGVAVNTDAVATAARDAADPDRAEALTLLGEAWPSEDRHDAHLALAGGLLTSGVSDSEAVEILCRVAVAQDPNNEDRPKRESTVARTRDRITKGERVVGWTSLAGIIGGDVVARAKDALQAPPKLARDQLERYAKSLRGKRDDKVSELGEALVKVCDGQVFATPGNRNDVMLRLSNALGEHFYNYDAASIAEHFVPSFQLIGMNSPTCPTADDVASAVERRQREVKGKNFTRQQEERDAQSLRIRDAFQNGRSKPYTKAEIASFGPKISKRWILQKDKAFYLFFNGGYRGPFTDAAVVNAAATHLSPASSAGVQLYTFNDSGKPVFKNIKQIVDDYGTVALSSVADLRAQRTVYDEATSMIIEAPCPLRPLKAVYHEDVEAWLRLLCWDHPVYYENLKTWIAVVTRLDFICSALFLTGRKSVGKSMLALGLSRLWTLLGPTTLEAAFDTFNDAIAACPLTFADEHLPKDFRGHTKNAELRVHIQALERAYRRKFLPNSKLIGATRTIIAAHDKSILKTGEQISNNEAAGIAERYFYLPTNPAAADFLERLSPSTYDRGWVSGDKIAEHALWLRENHKHQSAGRFYVRVVDEGLFRSLTTQSGVKGAVCQWLVSYLLDPSEFHKSAYSRNYVRVHDGKLFANVRGLMRCWDIYIGKNEKCPPTGQLARALGELSHDARAKADDTRGVRTNYRIIDVENLLSWAEDNGFADREQILEALKRETGT